MINKILFAVLLLFTSVILGEPALHFTDTLLDCGAVPRRYTLEKSFSFINTSKDTVLLDDVTTSCGCTSVDFTPQAYGPGDSGKISVEYLTHIVESDFFKNVFVSTKRNRKTENYTLALTGIIQNHIRVTPPLLNLENYQIGNLPRDTITIQWNRPEPFDGTFLKVPDYLSITKLPGSGNIHPFEITLSESATLGYKSDSLKILTGVETFPSIDIACEGEIIDIIAFVPSPIINLRHISNDISQITSSLYIQSTLPIDSVLITSSAIKGFSLQKKTEQRSKLNIAFIPKALEKRNSIPITLWVGERVYKKEIRVIK